MAKSAAKTASPAKKKSAASPAKTPDKKPPIVEIADENGEAIQPPPPEVVEPDPEMTPEEAEALRKSYLLSRFWISARGFWGRHGDRLAWPFSIGLLILIVGNVGLQYGINVWNRAIFDGIEKRDAATVYFLTAVFFPLAIGSVLVGVAQVYARMGIQRRWRAWLTNAVLTRWLANGRYYQLNLVGGDHKNPEYRIAEDLRVATDSPVDFMAGVTSAFLSATTFIVVLWTIGGSLTLTLGGTQLTIPGFLVVAAIVYAAIASGSASCTPPSCTPRPRGPDVRPVELTVEAARRERGARGGRRGRRQVELVDRRRGTAPEGKEQAGGEDADEGASDAHTRNVPIFAQPASFAGCGPVGQGGPRESAEGKSGRRGSIRACRWTEGAHADDLPALIDAHLAGDVDQNARPGCGDVRPTERRAQTVGIEKLGNHSRPRA